MNSIKDLAKLKMEISYLDMVKVLDKDFDSKQYILDELLPLLERKEIPEFYHQGLLRNIIARRLMVQLQGFALVSQQWIDPMAEYLKGCKCLEIMAGLGTISSALQKRGVDIISTDNKTWENQWNISYWTDVEEIDAIEAIEKYGADMDYIIMSWAYLDDTSYKCLQTMRSINPDCKMIVIGEGEGGCTSDDLFFESIEHVDDPIFDTKVSSKYQRWDCIYDYIQIVK